MVDLLFVLHIIFGILFVLFIPGYALSWAFFPKKEQLDVVERIVLSFALSISTVSIFIFYMNSILKIPITFFSTLFVILFLTLIGTVVWYKRVSKEERRNFLKFIKRRF